MWTILFWAILCVTIIAIVMWGINVYKHETEKMMKWSLILSCAALALNIVNLIIKLS